MISRLLAGLFFLFLPVIIFAQSEEEQILTTTFNADYITKYFADYDHIHMLESASIPDNIDFEKMTDPKPTRLYTSKGDLLMRNISRWIQLNSFWVKGNLAKVEVVFATGRSVTFTLNKVDGNWEIQ